MTSSEIIAIIGGLSIGYAAVWLSTRKNKAKDFHNSTYEGEKKSSTGNSGSKQKEESRTNENPFEEFRIFLCPSCKQQTRVKIPLKGNKRRCSKCNSKFHISIDEHGNLYITGEHHSGESAMHGSQVNSIDDCFSILDLSKGASSKDIKSAYRKKIKEYHPDKVSHLGQKLKSIADREAKKLNAAYTMLKDGGYV